MLIRSFFAKKLWLLIMTTAFMLVCGGCTYVDKFKEINSTPAIMTIPAEKVQQIDMIELKKAPDEAAVKPESVEPEKAEYTLSIEDCRALTLENNLDLRVSLIEPTIQRERVGQEEAKYEATFSETINYTKINQISASRIDGSKEDRVNIDLGVDMPLRTGGTLSFDLADKFNKSDSAYRDPVSYTAGLSASISQPLLKGAGRRADTYSIRVAQYNSQATDLRTKTEAIRILSDVDKAYWNLYASRRTLEVRRQQYDLAKATFEETKRFVEVGVKPRIEIIRTEADMARSLKDIISAENDVRVKERDLKRTLNKKGLGMETKTIIIPSSPPDPVHYEIDRKSMVEHALENRMEILETEIQLILDNMKIENYRNQTLPDLSFDYTYNINGVDAPSFDEFGNIIGSAERRDAYDMLQERDSNYHVFALRMNIPIGNKKAKSQLRQAIYERAQNLAKKENREAEIRSQVLNHIDTLEANWQGILASRQNTILSDEQYKAEKRQYELGLVSSKDVLSARTELAQAQLTEIESITNYQISIIDLAYATGTLLGAAKVEWAPVVPAE